MIDIHCHILPGIDDGAVNLAEAVQMAKIAHADGIDKIVATPHINEPNLSRQSIMCCHEMLSQNLKMKSIPVDVLLGGEVSYSLDLTEFNLHTINGTIYVLVEFPASHLPKNTGELIFNLNLMGLHPIIAHPERNTSVLKDPRVLLELLNMDVLVQITAASITGEFGPDIMACARFLLQKGVVDFIASDAHSAKNRKPTLSEGVHVAGKIIGKEKALAMVTINPAALLDGNWIENNYHYR